MKQNPMNEFLVVQDEEYIIRPLIGIWPADEKMLKYFQPDIDKLMKRLNKGNGRNKLIKVRMEILEEIK